MSIPFINQSKIIFGFDKKEGLENALKFLQDFNDKRKAEIEFIHVVKEEVEEAEMKEAVDEIIDEMVEEYIDYPFTIKKIIGTDIEETLVDYSININADVLFVYHQNTGLLERIFNRSSSLEIAQKLPLPVFILPTEEDD
jgi:nucleotide-binding universal stress UspA family protein